MLLSLSTGHTIGLLLVAGGFIVFALVCSLVIPRRWPDFPGTHMGWFIAVALVFFVGTLFAVNFFGVEARRRTAKPVGSTPTETQATTTGRAPRRSAAPAGDATQGKALYTSLGCVGCHSLDGSKGTGPTFKGLAGSQVQLTNGQSVVADPAYLEKSIENADAEDVPGVHARDHERRDQAGVGPTGGQGRPGRYIQTLEVASVPLRAPERCPSWPKERDWKSRTCGNVGRGFESRPLRHVVTFEPRGSKTSGFFFVDHLLRRRCRVR